MKPFKVNLLICFFILIALQCDAQIAYPHHVIAGQKFNVVSNNDTTFWILKSSQFDSALVIAKTLKITEQQLDIQKQITKNRDSVIINLSDKVNVLDSAYHRYVGLWQQCDSTLQKKEINIVHLKSSRKKVGIVCGVSGFVIGFLLGILIP